MRGSVLCNDNPFRFVSFLIFGLFGATKGFCLDATTLPWITNINIPPGIITPDATPPKIYLKGGCVIYRAKGGMLNDPGAYVIDNLDATRTITGSFSNLDMSSMGNYNITYNASDNAGNQATPITRTVCVTQADTSLSLTNQAIGRTPQLLGYNLAHFTAGLNASEWLRYSGVTATRIFGRVSLLKPTEYPLSLDCSLADVIVSCRNSIPEFGIYSGYYNSLVGNADRLDESGNNRLILADALSYCKSNGLQVCLSLTASDNFGNPGIVANQGEIWRFYYMTAYWAAKNYGVQRYQIWNEPDGTTYGISTNGYSNSDYLALMKVASSAIQCAIKDVNTRTFINLTASVRGPVTAGSADSDIDFGSLGYDLVANNLAVLTETSSDASQIIQFYDYHHYGGSLVTSGAQDFANQQAKLDAFLAGKSTKLVTNTVISEFNTHTANNFRTPANSYATNTLDNSEEAKQFGLICFYLLTSGVDEMYAFKFGQTGTSTNIAKNGMHYVDNSGNYNVGGITLAGEVWRLINKGFGPGKELLRYSGSPSEGLFVLVSRDASAFYCLSVNTSASEKQIALDVAGTGEAPDRFLMEVCSSQNYGSVSMTGVIINGQLVREDGVPFVTQPGSSVSLISIPRKQFGSISVISSTADTQLTDGAKTNSAEFGSAKMIEVRNSATNIDQRSVGLLRFGLPAVSITNRFQRVLLKVSARAGTNNGEQKALGRVHVYGLSESTNAVFNENLTTWSSYTNYLQQGGAAVGSISNNVVKGMSNGSVRMLGQMVINTNGSNTNSIYSIQDCVLDVTSFVQSQTNATGLTFLLARDVRFAPYQLNTGSPIGGVVDPIDEECFAFVSREGATTMNDTSLAPQLITMSGTGTFLASYEAWIQNYPSLFGVNAERTADPDRDGMSNQDEYAFGTNPTNAGSRSLSAFDTGTSGQITLRWLQRDGVTYAVKSTADLSSGFTYTENGANASSPQPLALPDGYSQHEITITKGGMRKFIRIQATVP